METRLCKTLKSWNHHTTQEATQSHVHNYFHVVTLKWKYNFLRKREHGQHSSNEEVGFPLQIGSAFEVKGGGGETETVFPDLYNAQWQIQIYSKGKILHCVKDFTQNNHLSTPNAHAYRHICLFVFLVYQDEGTLLTFIESYYEHYQNGAKEEHLLPPQ